ncbi:MAG: T9SS type A sorting domain-containing protein [Ignavibacteriae bacterium]|nr:T9SS type A sorting domain-containing protein [Ignavibacteriota bacterium]
MKQFKLTFLVVALMMILSNVGWGQWTYDFGTGTGSYAIASGASTTLFTSTPSNGGTYRVRCASTGNFGSGFILANPGTTLGTGTELQINSSITGSTNKFGVYDWTSPSTVAYMKCKFRTTSTNNGTLNISLGVNTLVSDANGYTSQYNNSLTSLTMTYATGSISTVTRRISGANSTISGSGFSKDANQVIEIYANNGAGSVSYSRSGSNYTLATKTWDLWVDGVQVVINAATAGTLAAGTNLSGFGFFGESSTGNAAFMYIDDLEYSNSLPLLTPTITLASLNPSIAAANITQGTTKNLIYKFNTAVSTDNATINSVAFTTGGTYVAADVSKFQLWYKAGSDDFSTATQIGSDITTSLGTGVHSFSSLTQVINSGTTGYFYIATDVQGSATVTNYINVSAIASADLIFASGNKSGTAYAGGNQTIIVPITSNVALSSPNPAVAAGNITQNTSNNVIYRFDLAVTTADAVLSGLQITTAGTYSATDLTNLKAWYSADNTFSSGTDVLLSTKTTSLGTGTQVFPSFTTQTITVGTAGYIFITTDIPCGANGNTIYVSAVTTSDITFLAANKTGTAYDGGTQTFTYTVPNNASSFAASNENLKSTLTWAALTGCYNDIMIVASATAFTSAVPSGNSYVFNLDFTSPLSTTFDGGKVVYKGTVSPETVTGLTNGTTYNFKIFTRNGTNWSSGVTTTATPSSNKYAQSIITSWATGPWYDAATGGSTTTAPGIGDNVFTNGNTVTVDADATCDNLTITNITGAITINDGMTLTVRGLLDFTASVTIDVIGGTGNGTIKFTGASLNSAPYYVFGSNLTASAVFDNIIFSSGDLSKELNTNAKRLKFLGTITVETGSAILNGDRNYTTGANIGIVTISEGAQLTLSGSSFLSGASSAGTKINSINVNGTFITSSVIDATSLTIGTNGLLKITKSGDFYTSTPTFTCNGTTEYGNSGAQNIYGTVYNNLKISGSGTKSLSGNATVNGTLTMTSGLLQLSTNNLTLANAVSGASSSSYIVTNSTGVLTINNIGTTETLFPVGTATSYNPALIINNGTEVDNFSVKVGSTLSGTPDLTKVVQRQWDLAEAIAGGSDVTLKLQFINTDCGINFDPAGTVQMGHYVSNAWIGLDGVITGSNPYILTTSGITSFSPFSVGMQGSLPVSLATLNSAITGRNIKLNWTTSSEQNNAGFNVERVKSLESGVQSWEKIGFISGKGTVNTPTNYSFEDRNLQTGKYKYRLKQIDVNGNFEYFALNGEVEIGVPKTFNMSQNYPNPFNPVTKINFDLPENGKVDLRLYDMLGREVATLVNEVRTAGYYTVNFNASSLSSGIYFYRMNAGKFSSIKKMAVIK